MHAFIIVSKNHEMQEKEAAKLLAPFVIDPVDITRIVPQNSIGIGELRELRRSISLTPYKSEVKAVIIEEAQTLTIEAQNAFLKTLEEPPNHTIIILFTNNADGLLPTVVSRCQVIELRITNYELPKDEFSVLSSQFSVLRQAGSGKRLSIAEEVAKDKTSAISWLEKMILAGRQILLDEVNQNKDNHLISQYLTILISFNRAHMLLATTNVNPRFTLEILFLSIPGL